MKTVPLNSIFDIEYGNQFDLYKLEASEDSSINFVSRSSLSLGVVCKVSKYNDVEPYPVGLITVTLGGTYLLSAFVQQAPFYTAQNIKILTPKKDMPFGEKLYYCKCIGLNRFRYTSHGREANITLDTLQVPERPPKDYLDFIENNITALLDIDASPKEHTGIELTGTSLEYHALKSLFTIKGKKTTRVKVLEKHGYGAYPYVTTRASNNGVTNFYDYYTEEGGVLTVDSAVTGYCAYQALNFSASDHVEKLIPKFDMNKYVAMFLATVLNMEQFRYNFGRKCCQARLKTVKIKLPSRGGKLDFEFMERYIKGLPYSNAV